MALGGLLSKLDPPQGGKVGGLGTVEALIEASMVAIGEGDDEVASLLHHLRSQQTTAGFIITLLSGPPQGEGTNALTLLKGMEYCFRMEGEIMVILCRRKLEHSSKQSGKNPDDKMVYVSLKVEPHTL